ncbi:LLC1 domain containing protein [Asbolus verrucosus]|uniref:LLC1 domain containing protein n=1 Tax=Asbolus verrucosus TaxID=1661398 RepID=A0A482WCN3_ASBVE|nr:LLC1 domain containing protein [Asbolus verrucosus]
MANLQANSKNNFLEEDLVKRNDILKALVVLEEKAGREWNQRWGFFQSLNELCVEEAAKQGVSEEEYRRWTVRRKSKTKALDFIWDLKMAESVPKTSSAMVGWRSHPEHSLERMGRLYISPLHTLPPKEHVSHILLG